LNPKPPTPNPDLQGTVILGGAVSIMCCWNNRETGHLNHANSGDVSVYI